MLADLALFKGDGDSFKVYSRIFLIHIHDPPMRMKLEM
jgi:hypothetical protein